MRLIVTQLLLSLFVSQEIMSQEIFNFTNSSDVSGWMVVDDIVMGGRSSGLFRLDKDGTFILPTKNTNKYGELLIVEKYQPIIKSTSSNSTGVFASIQIDQLDSCFEYFE